MIHLAVFVWHPLGYCTGSHGATDACRGYNFWSGIFSDLTIFTGFMTGLYMMWRKHNCHVHRCWRLQWHVDPEHGHPVCKRHHPDHPKGGGTGLKSLGHASEHNDDEGMETRGCWSG